MEIRGNGRVLNTRLYADDCRQAPRMSDAPHDDPGDSQPDRECPPAVTVFRLLLPVVVPREESLQTFLLAFACIRRASFSLVTI